MHSLPRTGATAHSDAAQMASDMPPKPAHLSAAALDQCARERSANYAQYHGTPPPDPFAFARRPPILSYGPLFITVDTQRGMLRKGVGSAALAAWREVRAGSTRARGSAQRRLPAVAASMHVRIAPRRRTVLAAPLTRCPCRTSCLRHAQRKNQVRGGVRGRSWV